LGRKNTVERILEQMSLTEEFSKLKGIGYFTASGAVTYIDYFIEFLLYV
jgi:hypothetical protein